MRRPLVGTLCLAPRPAALLLLLCSCAGGSASRAPALPAAARPDAEEAPQPAPPVWDVGLPPVAAGTAPGPHPATPTAPGAADPRGYTCPMHPAVRAAAPGRCPQCGMKLVPASPEQP